MFRKTLAMLSFAALLAALGVVASPVTAGATCTPIWQVTNRLDTYVNIYDRNTHANTRLQYTAVLQWTINCPGPVYAKRSTTLQIGNGTTPFNARVVVWKPAYDPVHAQCEFAGWAGGSYIQAYPNNVTIFTLYGPQYDTSTDACWAHTGDGASDRGSWFYSRIATDGAPYFQPTCGQTNFATQNEIPGFDLCYTPPDQF